MGHTVFYAQLTFAQELFKCKTKISCLFFTDFETFLQTYTPSQEGARPICFVLSGMGSQWPGMCKQLLKIESFKKNIDACAQVLKTVDFDLYELLNCEDKNIYSNVLNSFVGITCIQVSLFFLNKVRYRNRMNYQSIRVRI